MNSNLKLTLEQLQILDTIVQKGSFSAAAEALHRVPSTISYAVAKLEQDLEVKLFLREGRRARLTEAGEELLRQGRHLLHSADQVERTVKRMATGWEAELRIAVSDLLSHNTLFSLLEEFYEAAPETRVRISREVLSGTWDALISGRADLAIGVCCDAPMVSGYSSRPLGVAELLLAVAPHHPLAEAKEPLTDQLLQQHRVVAVADTTQGLPARTVGILPGQNVLTVPDQQMKIQAQRAGLGIGTVPRHLIEEDIRAGRLVAKITEHGNSIKTPLLYAWRTQHQGKGLAWLKRRLSGEKEKLDWFAV